jgi:hypothetical protein
MNGTPHERLVWKLSMLAVKYRLKPAFLYVEFERPAEGLTVSKAAERLGLAAILKAQQRRLTDPTSPVEVARYVNGEGRGLWIYRREETTDFMTKLAHLMNGTVETSSAAAAAAANQGTTLGYPACCVRWYEENVEKR